MNFDHLKSRDEITTTPEPYQASILADSIAGGVRLVTAAITIPRFELPAFNTHRVFSRNSASSRAIPVHVRIAQVRENPYIPLKFGKNKSGMQSTEEVEDTAHAEKLWREACDAAIWHAEALAKVDVHKQFANRLLEPFAWQTIIVSSTEWANWEALRISRHAQGEIALAARNLKAAMDASTPAELAPGQWHLPLVFEEDAEDARASYDADEIQTLGDDLAKIAIGRCARVSYLTHGGERDLAEDLRLFDRLLENRHMSPFEHAAQVGKLVTVFRIGDDGYQWRDAGTDSMRHMSKGLPPMPVRWFGPFIGNFRAPWVQYRKLIADEAVAPVEG